MNTESNEGGQTWRPKPLVYDPASTWISFADPADHPDHPAGGDYPELIAMDGAELWQAADRDRYGRLFAVSPELLAVLEDAPGPFLSGDRGEYLVNYGEWLSRAKAAIAKARGGG